MILFVIFQSVPAILLLTLVVCLYLVWVDVKDEPDLEFQIKIWWFLLVLLLHVPGLPHLPPVARGSAARRRADGQA